MSMVVPTFIVLVIVSLYVQQSSGCQDGWIQYHDTCYFFFQMKVTFPSAANFCHLLGAKLAEPTTDGEYAFIYHEITLLAPSSPFFIGITDMFIENNWVFLSNSNQIKTSAIKWCPSEPQGGMVENCVCFVHSGSCPNGNYLIDYPCTSRQYFICEKPAYNQDNVGEILG